MSREALDAKLKLYDRILASITAFGVIVGGSWAMYTHFELRHKEIALMVFKEKKEAYLALIDAAGEVTASNNRQEVVENAPLFLKLYYGRAHVIAEADPQVSKQKIAFKEKLMAYLDDERVNVSPFEYFGGTTFALTNACKVHIDPRFIEATKQ